MPDKSLREVLPLVNVFASATPTPLILEHLRKAAIRFCEMTLCWRMTATETIAAAPFSFSDVPDNALIHQVDDMYFGDPEDNRWLTPRQWSDTSPSTLTLTGLPTQWTQESLNTFYVLPYEAGDVIARLILKPRDAPAVGASAATINTVPDFMVDHHAQALAHGALETLMALPATITADANAAMVNYHKGLFTEATGAAQVLYAKGGQARRPLRTKASFL